MQKIDWREQIKELNKLTGKYYKWLVVLEVSLVGLLGWLFVLQGQYQQLSENGLLTFQQTAEDLASRQNYLGELRLSEQSYNELNVERIRLMERILPIGLEKNQLVADVQAFADAAGMTIYGIDATLGGTAVASEDGATTQTQLFTNKKIQTAVISVNIAGENNSYEELKSFLDMLESFVPVLDLRSINYTPETSSFALQLYTYYIAAE